MNEIYERPNGTRGVRTIVEGVSRTKQSFRDECDINGIMKRYERTGLITHQAAREAYFADVSSVPDFAAAVDVVRKAEDMFLSLPAKLRVYFGNDAAAYVAFCADPANADKMAELGLVDVKLPPEPMKVEVVNQPVPAGGGA